MAFEFRNISPQKTIRAGYGVPKNPQNEQSEHKNTLSNRHARGRDTCFFSHSTAYFIQNEYKASIDRLTTKSHQREPFRQFAQYIIYKVN